MIVFQSQIAKNLQTVIERVIPLLPPEHQQQVAVAVEQAKQVTMNQLNTLMVVSGPKSSPKRPSPPNQS